MHTTHSSEEAAFLQTIAESRDDVVTRLVYADWLEERGDPRAACLRAEVAAARILGRHNTHGILDAEEHFGVRYTDDQLAPLSMVPFDEETLRECRDSHLLVAGYSLTLDDLEKRHPEVVMKWLSVGSPGTVPFEWLVHPRWLLLRKEPVPQSPGKFFQEQIPLLTEAEDLPWACEVVYAALMRRLAIGEGLLQNVFVRCADVDPCGDRIIVGSFGSGKSNECSIACCQDTACEDYLGWPPSGCSEPLLGGHWASLL